MPATTKGGGQDFRLSRVPAPRNATDPTAALAASLPIHLLHPSANRSSVLPWSALAAAWDRRATFDDLAALAQRSALPSVPPGHRVVLVLHCAPKMGSSTLRAACRENYRHSCGLEPLFPTDPNGYAQVDELARLVRRCTTTHHFCLRLGMFTNRTAGMEKISFFHLYPFRTYDAWAVSALKQPFDNDGEQGCTFLRRMMATCTDNHGELAFFKYPKARMSEAGPIVARRMTELGEAHHTVAYPFREVDAVLAALGARYGIPRLRGSDGRMKTVHRTNGTCDSSILDRFHECFSDRLAALP